MFDSLYYCSCGLHLMLCVAVDVPICTETKLMICQDFHGCRALEVWLSQNPKIMELKGIHRHHPVQPFAMNRAGVISPVQRGGEEGLGAFLLVILVTQPKTASTFLARSPATESHSAGCQSPHPSLSLLLCFQATDPPYCLRVLK